MTCQHSSDTCPYYEPKAKEPKCEISDCKEEATYKAWLRLRDCLGVKTGHLVLVQICKRHKTHPWLVANEKTEGEKA